MNKDKRNNIQLLGTLNNSDESGIIANANQIYDANEDKSTQDVSKEHTERIKTLETKENSMQTTLENISKTGEASAASNVTYNHSDSKLDATNVQQAIDEVKALLDNKRTLTVSEIDDTELNGIYRTRDNDTSTQQLLIAGKKTVNGVSTPYQIRLYVNSARMVPRLGIRTYTNRWSDYTNFDCLKDSKLKLQSENLCSASGIKDYIQFSVTKLLDIIGNTGNVNIEWSVGCALNSINGALGDNTARDTSSIISIEDNIISVAQNAKYFICFYDVANNFVSGTNFINSTKYNVKNSLPSNAAYYRICVDNSVCNISDITIRNDANLSGYGILHYLQILKSIIENGNSIYKWLENTAINGDTGIDFTGTNRTATVFIPSSLAKFIVSSGLRYFMFFYDAQKNYLGSGGGLCYFNYYDLTENQYYRNDGFVRCVIDTSYNSNISDFRILPKIETDILFNSFKDDEALALSEGLIALHWYGDNVSVGVNTGDVGTYNNRNTVFEKIPLSDAHHIQVTGSARYVVAYYTQDDTYLGYDGFITENFYLLYNSSYYSSASYIRIMIDTSVITNTDNVKVFRKPVNRDIIVDASGNSDYNSLADALKYAGDSQTKHVTIRVRQGEYLMPQKVSNVAPYVEDNRNLTIIGENQNTCILYNNIGFYDYTIGTDCTPLRLNGNVVIENLTIISLSTEFDNYVNTPGYVPRDDNRKSSYCIHRDGQNYEGSVFKVKNCKLINDHMTCIGFGLRTNTELIIEDTYAQTEQATEHSIANSYGILYGHYNADKNKKGLGQNLSIIRCQLVNKTSNQAINIMDAKASDATPQDTFGNFKFIGNAVNTTNVATSLVIASSLKGFYSIDPLSFGNAWE